MTDQPIAYAYYLGEKYPLYVNLDKSVEKVILKFNNKAFECTSPVEEDIDLNQALKSFYIKESRKLITQRLKHYQSDLRVKYKSITIENVNSRWGSCSSNKNLTFNWRLMLLPLKVIDYVVVHELCHLKHMNHDRSFWRLVGKIYPDYKEAMEFLGTKKSRDL